MLYNSFHTMTLDAYLSGTVVHRLEIYKGEQTGELQLRRIPGDGDGFNIVKERYALWYVHPATPMVRQFLRNHDRRLTGEDYRQLFKEIDLKEIKQYDQLQRFLEEYEEKMTDSDERKTE